MDWGWAIAMGSGVAFALLAAVAVIVLSGDEGGPAATTTSAVSDTTTSTVPPPDTTIPPEPTTVPAPPTTEVDFASATEPVANDSVQGNPGPGLTDVRFGAHPGYSRVVLEFTGEGVPAYQVRYHPGPFVTAGEGSPVEVAGAAFLWVTVFPGSTHDPEDGTPVYQGALRLEPRLGAIVEMVFLGDFEANLEWVIGLSEEKGFRAFTLADPVRLVVDIAD